MSKIRCIVIEDEPLAVKVLSDYISQVPFLELQQTFKDAISATDWLRNNQTDLIFLDINLPKVNGIECLRTIRELKDYSGIPIIMYSTSADASNIEESYKSGADRYFTKPATFGALCNSLNKIREIEWIKDGKISLAGFII